jgi:hypothetical protein
LSRLTQLDLRYTNVSDEGLKHLGSLSSVKTLCLSGTRVSDVGLRHLSSLLLLEELDLRGTGVTEEALRELGRSTNLRALYLSVPEQSDAYARVQEAHSKTRIFAGAPTGTLRRNAL